MSNEKVRFRFQRLDVWQEARVLNREIYELTRGFPKEELFGLTSQMRRSSRSVAANIAEGSGRNSDRDFRQFLEISYGSATELASDLYLASDVALLLEPDRERLLDRIEAVTAQLSGLNRTLRI